MYPGVPQLPRAVRSDTIKEDKHYDKELFSQNLNQANCT